VVAGNLLRLVNSALYARRGTINSVRYALSLLGMDKVRNAVLGMSLTRMWSKAFVPQRWSMARFDIHSAAVAILSDLLAQRLPVEYPEGAFVAGLLHDLGQLLIATGLPEECERIDEQGRLASEREVLGFTHAELSAEALAVWNLPEAIQNAVLHHHNPECDQSSKAGMIPLSAVIAASNNYLNSVGVSIALNGDPESSDATLVERLGLSGERLDETIAEFRAEFEVMMKYFKQP
jgi:putative nucleotidyltransferase with HDIG domain